MEWYTGTWNLRISCIWINQKTLHWKLLILASLCSSSLVWLQWFQLHILLYVLISSFVSTNSRKCIIIRFLEQVSASARLLEVHFTWHQNFWSAVMAQRLMYGVLELSYIFCSVEFHPFGQVFRPSVLLLSTSDFINTTVFGSVRVLLYNVLLAKDGLLAEDRVTILWTNKLYNFVVLIILCNFMLLSLSKLGFHC